jgi:DNA polymerase-1
VDETVLKGLPYPEAPKRSRSSTSSSSASAQLAEGKEAWMKHVGADGRIHGAVNTNGAVTGRMTHAFPNVAQVPATRSPYGAECRALFIVPPDKELVGADADALELRCLAHFMARYDDGAYVRGERSARRATAPTRTR